ncbi:MAG: hypothetical protein R2855_15235 [Thermomicrobiales bacterium]
MCNSGQHLGYRRWVRRFLQRRNRPPERLREIKPEEAEACAANGVEYYVFEVAYDGIAVVVNPENDFVECLTVDQLKLM